MKKIVFYLVCFSTLFVACKKDTPPVFDDPDKRLIEKLDGYQKLLTGAEHGWTATLFPDGGQGFTYYLDFKDKNSVTMFSDFDSVKAMKEGSGSYILKALQQPTLIFDTYSYIHAPADPNEKVSGGTRGSGLDSDFEFAFVENTDNSVTLKGIYNGSIMVLNKTSAADAAKIKAGGLKNMMSKSDAYFKATPYKFIQFSDGRKVEFTLDKKEMLLTWADDQGEVTTVSTPFGFLHDRLVMKEALNYSGESFGEVMWDDSAKEYYITVGSKRYSVQSSTTPIIPLHFRFGYGKEFAVVTVNPANLTGLPAVFMDVYNAAVAGLDGYGGRSLNYFMITFTAENEMHLRLNYFNKAGTSNFNADYIHAVHWIAANRVKFTFTSRNNNGNVISSYVAALTDYIAQHEFVIDWAGNLTPGSTALLGGFTTAGDPSNYFFGVLSK